MDDTENFADALGKGTRAGKTFYDWLDAVEADVAKFVGARSLGVPSIWASLKKPFGEAEVKKAQNNYGLLLEGRRKAGVLRMAEKTATLSSVGRTAVVPHKFHGSGGVSLTAEQGGAEIVLPGCCALCSEAYITSHSLCWVQTGSAEHSGIRYSLSTIVTWSPKV